MNNTNLPFTIEQVAKLLGLDRDAIITPTYMDTYCPFCGYKERRILHIRFDNSNGGGVYRCPKCNSHGGTLALYANIAGCSFSEAYTRIKEGLKIDIERPVPVKKYETPKVRQAPIEKRDEFYRMLLTVCPLSREHKDNLIKRGVSIGFEYGSFTDESAETGKLIAREIISILGQTPDGVPGFYKNEHGEWSVALRKGMLIPVKNPAGQIQGIQVRVDVPLRGAKYLWLSTNPERETYKNSGTAALGYIHCTTRLDAANAEGLRKTVYITEGPLKGNIAHELSGRAFICLPGVNVNKFLPELLKELYGLGYRRVVNTFDMDRFENEHVMNACNTLKKMVNDSDMEWLDFEWDSSFKGVDDYLLAKKEGRCQIKKG